MTSIAGSTPEQRAAAHGILSKALYSGDIVRADNCEDCGAFATETLHGHHEDYEKPLDVNWLCRSCHGKRHRGTRGGGEPKVSLRVDLTPRIFTALHEEAHRLGVTKRSIFEAAIRAELNLPAKDGAIA